MKYLGYRERLHIHVYTEYIFTVQFSLTSLYSLPIRYSAAGLLSPLNAYSLTVIAVNNINTEINTSTRCLIQTSCQS